MLRPSFLRSSGGQPREDGLAVAPGPVLSAHLRLGQLERRRVVHEADVAVDRIQRLGRAQEITNMASGTFRSSSIPLQQIGAPAHLTDDMRPPLLLLVPSGLMMAVLACGTAPARSPASARPSSTPAATATPAPAPTPAAPVIALTDESEIGAAMLRLVGLDGRERTRLGLPARSTVAGVGGGVAVFTDGETLKGLHPDGAVETLGTMTGYRDGRVVVSPDGAHWLWSVHTIGQQSSTSRIVLGTRGATDRTVAQLTSGPEARVLMPYRWTAGGPVYHSMVAGIGGYILFAYAFSPSWRLDLGSGRTTELTEACFVADLAADGTMACFFADAEDGSWMEITRQGAAKVQVTLPKPAFRLSGAASFRPGPAATTLAMAGATGEGANPGGHERFQTALVDVRAGTLRPFGPAGLRPGDGDWSWLPDGSVIAYHPALDGEGGVYVIAPDGSATKVFRSGVPVGVITG